MDHSQITLRAVTRSEYEAALDLWGRVFDVGRSYFEQCYSTDPWYQDGDTLGAWNGETRLVSAVHICRRPLAWNGRRLFCGGIANVATLPDYRGKGLSRRLLTEAVSHMERCGMHFSVLWTGIPAHYAQLGWEPLQTSTCALTLPAESNAEPEYPLVPAQSTPEITSLYQSSPRPLQLERSPEYWADWVDGKWSEEKRRLVLLPGKGYAVTETAKDDNGSTTAAIVEFRAVAANAERDVLLQAVRHLTSYANVVRLDAKPQFNNISDLEPLRATWHQADSGGMIRNVGLSPAEYMDVKDAYQSGRAVWWLSDHV